MIAQNERQTRKRNEKREAQKRSAKRKRKTNVADLFLPLRPAASTTCCSLKTAHDKLQHTRHCKTLFPAHQVLQIIDKVIHTYCNACRNVLWNCAIEDVRTVVRVAASNALWTEKKQNKQPYVTLLCIVSIRLITRSVTVQYTKNQSPGFITWFLQLNCFFGSRWRGTNSLFGISRPFVVYFGLKYKQIKTSAISTPMANWAIRTHRAVV